MSFNLDIANCEYVPLTELLTFIVDNRGKSAPTEESGIPLIATNCIKNNELYPVFEKVRYVSKETYETWFRAHPKPGDIIFVNKGTPGRVCLVPDPVNFCIAQDMMAFRVDNHKIYNKYLFAVLRSPQFQSQITNYHVGTMIPHFKKGDLNKLLIPLPELEVQHYIGDTYYRFCEKVENNKEINKKLEEMAQAIFKQWFVDFEFPNKDGEPYKSSGGEMVESELGMIPKGWEVKSVYDLAEYINGTSFKKEETNEFRGIPIIKIAELKNGITESTKYCTAEKDKKYYLKNGDILFSWSGNPYTSIDTFIWNKGNAVLNQHIFKVTSTIYDNELMYIILKYLKPDFINIASNKQTTGLGHITINDLKRMRIALPTDNLILKLSGKIKVLIEGISNNNRQNNNLIKLRDTLLPKLMSGEVRVPLNNAE